MPVNDAQHIEQIIARQGFYISTTAGVSMYPMIRDRRDTVIVTPCYGRLKKYDVPLYRRGDKYVLHRIIRVLPDSYVIRGDNCQYAEHGITDADIIGVLSGFYRDGKQINLDGTAYKAYIWLCRASYPFRWVYYCAKAAAQWVMRKVL